MPTTEAPRAGLSKDPSGGITPQRLEAHYLSGGNVAGVIRALIAASRAVVAAVEMGIFKLQGKGGQNTCTRRNNASVPA